MENTVSLSTLKAAIQINKPNLVQLINQQVDKALLHLPAQEVDMGQVIVSKKGDLTLDFIGQQIQLSIPLGIQFKGKKLLSVVEAQAAIELFFKIEMDFQPYWQLVTKTKLERYGWLDKPDVQFSVLNISVEKIADQLLVKNKEKIELQIDDAIAKYWTAAKITDIAEAFFQKSHQLRPEFPIYLKLSPERVQMSPGKTKDSFLFSQLDSRLTIELTSRPLSQQSAPLPTPSFSAENPESQSDINVNVLLDYKSIGQILRSQLVGQSFSYKENTITFSSLDLKKTGTALHFDIGLSGFIEGSIAMDWLPIYDESQNKITIVVQSFTMKANSFWKQSIVNLFSGRIKKEIEERLQYRLDDIPKLEQIQQLKEFSPQPDVRAKIDVQEINIRNFIVGEEGINCALKTKVDIEMVFLPSSLPSSLSF